jgi:hypothetical protein
MSACATGAMATGATAIAAVVNSVAASFFIEYFLFVCYPGPALLSPAQMRAAGNSLVRSSGSAADHENRRLAPDCFGRGGSVVVDVRLRSGACA